MTLLDNIGLKKEDVERHYAKALKGRCGRRGLPDNYVSAMHADYLRLKSLAKTGRAWGRTRQSMYEMFRINSRPLNSRPKLQRIVWHGRTFTPGKNGYYRETSGARQPLHRMIWRASTGREIPPGWQVGFKDGHILNFSRENLFCAPLVEVTLHHQRRLHPSARLPPEERHEPRKKLQREAMARKAAAYKAQGLRCDGRPLRAKYDPAKTGNRAWQSLRD